MWCTLYLVYVGTEMSEACLESPQIWENVSMILYCWNKRHKFLPFEGVEGEGNITKALM